MMNLRDMSESSGRFIVSRQNKNTRRYREDLWLRDLDSNHDYRSQSRFPRPMVSADSAPHLSPTITIPGGRASIWPP